MKRAVFLHIQSILRDYPRMDQYIENRRNSPYYCVEDDRAVNALMEQQAAIETALMRSDDLSKAIVDKLYFHNDPNQTIDRVAMELHISRNTLFYRRNKFLECIRHSLGW